MLSFADRHGGRLAAAHPAREVPHARQAGLPGDRPRRPAVRGGADRARAAAGRREDAEQGRRTSTCARASYVEYECGLLSIAFHPKFAENGFLYLSYTAKKPNLKSFITELRVDPKADHVDMSSERVVLTLDQPYPNHNGGQIGFGPDGYLYAGFGDGGSQRDPHDHGQRTDVLLGKILRLDVAPREGYGIPKDNPFVKVKGARPEIWARGLRNPWRFSWDPTRR
jgi:glucose/arabinose dehydrogenase